MVLVPEREREQPPELAREIRPAVDVVVEQARHGLRAEEALAVDRVGVQRRSGERLQLAAEPGGGGDRETALAAVDDLARQQLLDRLAQKPLLRQAAHLVAHRQREREVRHHRIQERDACLQRPRHRRPVGLRQQVVDEVEAQVDVLQAGHELVPFRLGEALPVGHERVERARAAGQFGPRVGREDLLPAVVALERRQVRRGDEPLRLVVEACASRRRRQPLDERPRERRERPDPLGERVRDVGVVAAEELVAAFARQRDLDVLRGQLRDEVGRERRRVGERLVEGCRERGQQQRGVGLQHQLPVVCSVPRRDRARAGELVERCVLEADRERAHGSGRLLRCERRERAGVDAARQEHSDGDVGDQMGANRVAEPRAALLDELGFVLVVACRQRPRPREPVEAERPGLPGEGVPGLQLADVAEDRERRRHRVEREERLERIKVDLALRQRIQLRRERQLVAGAAVVERLDAEAIACQRQSLRGARPRLRRRTFRAAAPRGRSPLLVAMHEHLGVAVRPKDVAGALQFAGELAIVVDLAVLDDYDAAVFVADRLVAPGQVDDREAPRGDPDPAIDVHPLRVGAAVDERRRHPAQPVAVNRAVRRGDPADAAHLGLPGERLPEHAEPGHDHGAQVQPDGAVGDPLEVMGELLGHRRLVAVAHLGESGQAGAHDEPLPVRR